MTKLRNNKQVGSRQGTIQTTELRHVTTLVLNLYIRQRIGGLVSRRRSWMAGLVGSAQQRSPAGNAAGTGSLIVALEPREFRRRVGVGR